MLGKARARLSALYLDTTDPVAVAQAKADALADLRADYQQLRGRWSGPPYFDGWFRSGLNNAGLAALSAYDQFVPAFAALLAQGQGDFPAFYAAVAELGELEPEARQARLLELGREGITQPGLPPNCETDLSSAPDLPGD